MNRTKMMMSMLSVLGGLLALVASQSCSDTSVNSASWVRLKPLGQCKDGESTCPYRVTFPPLTVLLPKPFRELEKMARELQSLTQTVNQLKEDCRMCNERQGMDWNKRTDDEGEDEERIQASKGTLNTRERQQDTVQVTTSRSAVEDTMSPIKDSDVEKQRNNNQDRNVNSRSTKPRAESNRGQKLADPLQKNPISGSMNKVGELPSLTTTKKKMPQTPMYKLTESSFPGDLDSEQPTQHEQHKIDTIKIGHEMYPSGTLNAKGKLKHMGEYYEITMLTKDDDNNEDNDDETKPLPTPKGDKILEQRRLVTGNDAKNNSKFESNRKQHTRKQQYEEDRQKVADPKVKESGYNIFDGSNSGNVSKEGSFVIPQPTMKNKGKKGKNNHSSSSTKSKPLKPGAYSEGDAEVNSRPAYKGSAKDSVNFRQINPHTLENKSKNQFKPDTDAKMDTAIESNVHPAETVSRHTTRLPIFGITDSIVNVSPTTGITLDSKTQLTAVTDPDSGAELNSNPVNNIDAISGLKNSKSPNPGRTNATANVDQINPKIQKSDFQTPFKPGPDTEPNTGMDSNPINKLETSRLPFPGKSESIDLSSRNPKILDSNNQFRTGTTSENDARMTLNPTDKFDPISGIRSLGSAISDKANVTDDGEQISPKRQRSNSKTAPKTSKNAERNTGMNSNPDNGQNISSSPVLYITDGMADVSPTNPQTVDITNQVKDGTDSEGNTTVGSNPVNDPEMVSGYEMLRSHVSSRSEDIVDLNPTNLETLGNKKQFRAETNSESVTVKELKPVNNATNAKVNVNHLNPHMVHSNFENSTINPVNKAERVTQLETPGLLIPDRAHSTADQINPQQKGYSPNNQLKLGNDSERKATNRDHTTSMVSQKETTESPLHPSLNISDDLPKRRFLPKSKFNMTQPSNKRIESSSSMKINTERKTAQRNNKTTSLRSDAMPSDRHLPTGILFMKPEKQEEITNHAERIRPPEISLGKNPIHGKPHTSQINPVNENKAFGNGQPKNTHGVTDYSMSNETTHVHSKTVSGLSNELNNTAYGKRWSVRPTTATQGILEQVHEQKAQTPHTVKALDIGVNHQIESTSQTTLTKPRLEKHGASSIQDPGLDTLNNIERDSQTPIMEKTKGTDRGTVQIPSKTINVDSNQENYKKTSRSKSMHNLGGKMPLDAINSERNELNHPTTLATLYTIKPEFKDKQSKMPQYIQPILSTTHFINQDHAEQSKTASGKVKVSNKQAHHRLDNPSSDTESRISQSDNGNKELQNASSGQGFNVVRNSKPNSLDSTQNTATSAMAVNMDIAKASTVSKMSTMSTESTNEDGARVSNPEFMDMIEASTETNWVTPLSDKTPGNYHKFGKTPLRASDSVEGNNGEHSRDKNNGNTYPVAVNRMTGAALPKILAGHTNKEDNKKPLGFKGMDDRQVWEKQLLRNCHGQCDLSPTAHPILNSRESLSNDRDQPSHDCSDFIMRNPTNGIHNVKPTRSYTFPVFCDMKSSGGGWTLIQHRLDGSISFNRTWNDYKRGFGKLTGEFWLGNDKIHWLTATKAMVLRIELEDLDGMKEYAQYNRFHVANESQNYRLTIEGYSGTAGDAMQYSPKFNHTQKNFTTPDRDNDQYTSGNCGAYYSSGWWFDACMAANLNGKYYQTKYRGVRNGIFWGTWHNTSTESYLTHYRQSFKTVKMMIRPRG